MDARIQRTIAVLLSSLLFWGAAGAVRAADSPRERLRIDAGWRFKHGDPPGLDARLSYDLRPQVTEVVDGLPADTPARPPETMADAGLSVLKPWILPSANAFIRDPAQRHTRPPGNPGGDVAYVQAGFDDGDWQPVDLPHDWAIEGPFLPEGPYGGMGRLPSWGIGWYRKALSIPASDAGKTIRLEIEGAMSYATVWLNGQLVGGWPYGYNSFQLDLTPYLRPGGENQLAIRLDNPPDSSRWYPGGGLYRSIYLIKTAPVHVGQWGGFVRTQNVSARQAEVQVSLLVDNDGGEPARVEVDTALYALDADGRKLGKPVAVSAPRTLGIPAGDSAAIDSAFTVEQPRLWGPPPTQTPNLYTAVTRIRQGRRLIDEYETVFGIRDLRFDADRGLLVNGERVPLRGVNNHHDLGALGAAFNRRAAQRQLEMLREMGVNAIRMSHNPPAPELLALTDRMGFLVVDEIFDVWYRKKTPLDFHLIFPDWHEPDLRALIRRDRNHPSVIVWSVGNEVGEQLTGEDGAAVGRRLVEIAHEEDPGRPVTASLNWSDADHPLPAVFDLINLNYQGVGVRTLPSDFPAFHAAHPDKLIFSSESAAAVSSRGEYQFPVSGSRSGPVRPGSGGDPDRRQVSAYELHAADFGSSADKSFALHAQHPYVAGEFVWTGFDYLGEPTPYYEARSSYFGIIDLAGFRKDRFYLYQSYWRPELPMAHLLPHWTWPGREGQVTPVHVFTSGDEAELFVNGESQGRLEKAPYQHRLRWDYVKYVPGRIEVVAYKDGEAWARDVVETAGEPRALKLETDRTTIAADGRDLAYVAVRIVDAQGRLVPMADDTVHFELEGPGEIVATDNGDPTSFVPFHLPDRAAFNGRAMAIVRALPGRSGVISLRAAAAGLESGQVDVRTNRSD